MSEWLWTHREALSVLGLALMLALLGWGLSRLTWPPQPAQVPAPSTLDILLRPDGPKQWL